MNKYEKWYDLITERSKDRILNSYTEEHHIIPSALGGPDDKENLVDLTAREHFICHWLLTKIYKDGEAHWKMINALRLMKAENKNQTRYKSKITSRVYAKLKEEYARLQSERMRGKNNPMYGKKQTEKAKNAISKANTGRVQPLEEKMNQVKAQTGRKRKPFTKEWLTKMSLAKTGKNNNRYGVKVTDETRKKIGDRIRGRKQTEAEKEVRRLANLGKKKEKKECPHCKQLIAVNGYARWHGNKCKSILLSST